MRNTIIDRLFSEAKKNSNLILITADLGYSVMEKFMKELPNQFVNTGIAEQNMVGVAAGLALAGKKVFVYTIVPFATMRCLEQIRVDVCYQNLDVTIIGVGGGFAYGTLGVTHYGLEDLAVMRSLPNMKVMCPADPNETMVVIDLAIKNGGPNYIRLNRGGESNVVDSKFYKKIKFGDIIKINDCKNNKFTVFSCGNILDESLKAVSDLNKKISLYSVPFLKPINKKAVIKVLKKCKVIFTVEEHNIIGGLGSLIAEIIAEEGLKVKLVRLGLNDKYFCFVGKQDYMRDAAGLSSKKIKKCFLQYV